MHNSGCSLPSGCQTQIQDKLSFCAFCFAEKYDLVTLLFSDIVKFTNIAAAVQPMDIVKMLNDLYKKFDDLIEINGVYKVWEFLFGQPHFPGVGPGVLQWRALEPVSPNPKMRFLQFSAENAYTFERGRANCN